MELFDQLRYGIALFLVAFAPASVVFWIAVHPLASVWRRVGYWWGYAAGFFLAVVLASACFAWRGWIARGDLGSHLFVVIPGLVLLAAAGATRRRLQRQLTGKTMFGLPELAPDKYPGRLLTDGLYARVRHPRYLQVVVAVLGWALLANYVAGYLAVLTVVAALAVVIPLEERELAQRFGAEYDDYRRRVPAVVPRLRSHAR